MLYVSKKKDALLRGIPLVLFFAFASLLSAQDAPPLAEAQGSSLADEAAQASTQPRQGRETDESQILIYPPDSSSEGSSARGTSARASSPAGSLLRLVVVLILLCVACFFIIRFLRKSQRAAAADDPFLKMTASLSLEQGRSVAVVTLGGRAFLLGVAEHSVSLIAEITDAELIDQMNLNAGMAPAARKSFAEVLSELIRKPRKEGGSSSNASSAQETAAFIRQRRESLKDMDGGQE